jgi:hypothetical protein
MQQQIHVPETQDIASPEIVRRQVDSQKEAEFQELYREIGNKEKGIMGDVKIHRDFIFVILMFCIYYIGYSLLNSPSKHNIVFSLMISLSMIFIHVLLRIIFQYLPYNRLCEQAKSLDKYNDMRSLGITLRLSELAYTKTRQNQSFAMLKPLLEAMTKNDVEMLQRGGIGASLDVGYVKERHQNSLRNLANHPRIRREFPELMQAIIVALYNFHTAENKQALEKLAKEKPKIEEDKWIPKAAQSCLDAWSN